MQEYFTVDSLVKVSCLKMTLTFDLDLISKVKGQIYIPVGPVYIRQTVLVLDIIYEEIVKYTGQYFPWGASNLFD